MKMQENQESTKFTKIQHGLLRDWNTNFPEHPLAERHIKNPDEAFFRRNIILCLNKLLLDVSCFANIDNESGSRLKVSRCRLVAITNEILKSASSGSNFSICYMDLLKPKRQITQMCLQFLVNYVIFFDHALAQVKRSYQLIQHRNNLRSQKNQLRKTIEDLKISDEQSVKHKRDIEKKIPQLQAQVAMLKNREECLLTEIAVIHQEMDKTDMIVDEIKTQCDGISEHIVSDYEAESIFNCREQVQNQLDEQEEIITAGRLKLKENSTTIERVQSFNVEMEQIISTTIFDTAALKQTKMHLQNLIVAACEMINSIEENSREIKNLEKTENFKKETVAKLNKLRNVAEAKFHNVLRINSNQIKQKVAVAKNLQAEEEELLDEKIAIKDEIELLYNIVSNIIKQMSESIFE